MLDDWVGEDLPADFAEICVSHAKIIWLLGIDIQVEMVLCLDKLDTSVVRLDTRSHTLLTTPLPLRQYVVSLDPRVLKIFERK